MAGACLAFSDARKAEGRPGRFASALSAGARLDLFQYMNSYIQYMN
jgi:hypothetical protein